MNVNDCYQHALLSEASYADLEGVTTPKQLETILIASGFSDKQAAEFVTHWRVVDHRPNTLVSGFSGTLFERLDANGIGTGQYTLAIRGTEASVLDPRDLVVDLGLAAGLVPQRDSLESYYNDLVGMGILNAGQKVAVTGHSLGGFLAQLFAVDHPGVVEHAYTYDAPGIGGAVAEVLELFGLAEGEINTGIIDNFYGTAGANVIAELGTMLGETTPVFIEDRGLPWVGNFAGNHAIAALTDSLAVQGRLKGIRTYNDNVGGQE